MVYFSHAAVAVLLLPAVVLQATAMITLGFSRLLAGLVASPIIGWKQANWEALNLGPWAVLAHTLKIFRR
jgi:predicted transporter